MSSGEKIRTYANPAMSGRRILTRAHAVGYAISRVAAVTIAASRRLVTMTVNETEAWRALLVGALKR